MVVAEGTRDSVEALSILYQALSRAARENAAATQPADQAGGDDVAPTIQEPRARQTFADRLATISFRPKGGGGGSRRGLMIALIAILVLIAGGWLYTSTLPRGSDPLAEIPLVSDVAEMLGLIDPDPILIVDYSDEEWSETGDVAGGTTGEDDQDIALLPPASIEQSESPGGGIEIEGGAQPGVDGNSELEAFLGSDTPEEPDVDPAVAEAVADAAPEPLLPADSAAVTDDPLDEDAGPTLEETLARLNREQSFDDLQPPVEIDRTDGDLIEQDDETFVTIEIDRDSQQESFEEAYRSLVAGNTDAALDLYLDVLKDDPNNTFALFGLATTLQRVGWLAEARSTYEELLSIEPHHTGALTNMMAMISEEAPDQALANLTRLYDINPGYSPIPAQIGLLLAEQGDYQQAITNMQLAISLSPDNMMYVFNLAIIYDRMGNHDRAERLYEQVLAASETRDLTVPLDAVRDRLAYLRKL